MSDTVDLIFACAIIRHGPDVLIVRPHTPSAKRGRWAFPAGPVGADEAPETALRRACRDALGVDIRVEVGQPPLRADVAGKQVIYRYFFCDIGGGEPHNLDFAEIRWVRVGQLREYEFDPTTETVADWLIEHF